MPMSGVREKRYGHRKRHLIQSMNGQKADDGSIQRGSVLFTMMMGISGGACQ